MNVATTREPVSSGVPERTTKSASAEGFKQPTRSPRPSMVAGLLVIMLSTCSVDKPPRLNRDAKNRRSVRSASVGGRIASLFPIPASTSALARSHTSVICLRSGTGTVGFTKRPARISGLKTTPTASGRFQSTPRNSMVSTGSTNSHGKSNFLASANAALTS